MSKTSFSFFAIYYVNMIVSTLTFISEKCGEEMPGDALEYQYEKCEKVQLAII